MKLVLKKGLHYKVDGATVAGVPGETIDLDDRQVAKLHKKGLLLELFEDPHPAGGGSSRAAILGVSMASPKADILAACEAAGLDADDSWTKPDLLELLNSPES